MGYLCLPISTLIAQVADPPGADLLLHRSMPHRGGDSRSDTFLSVTSQEIDGGPILLPARCGGSSACPPWRVSGLPSQKGFSLIDSDQDMRIGLEHSSFQSASVSVSGIPINSDRESDPQKPTTQSLGSYVLGLDTNISLVDDSISQGQEKRDSQAVIWGRISEYGDRNQVRLQVYPEYFFDSPKAPGANLLYIPLKLGNIMEGAYPKSRSFQYNLQPENEPQWISLSLGESVPFIKRFRIDSGDTVQLFLNLESNSLVFSGPSAAKFRLQQDLHRLEEEAQVQTRPVLWTQNPDQVLSDSTYAAQFEEAKAAAGPLLEIKARSIQDLIELEEKDLYSQNGLMHRSWDLIHSYRNQLSDSLLEFFRNEVELREWRKYLLSINSNLLYARREGKDQEFLSKVIHLSRNKIDAIQPIISKGISPYSAEMMDLLDAQSRLEAGIAGTDRYTHYPIEDHYWNDKMLVRLFYDNFNRVPNATAYLSSQLETLRDSRYKSWLEYLLRLKGDGQLISGFEFLDKQGELKTFEEIAKGKIILLEFWISGCKACLAFNENTLTKIKEEFAQDPRVQVVTVSADFTKELWISGLESGKYTQEEFVNLYTGSLNRKHPFLIQYGISSFPNRILLDGDGRIIQASQVPFLSEELIPLLQYYLNNSQPKPQSTL